MVVVGIGPIVAGKIVRRGRKKSLAGSGRQTGLDQNYATFYMFDLIFIFREGGRREKKRERNIDVREKH